MKCLLELLLKIIKNLKLVLESYFIENKLYFILNLNFFLKFVQKDDLH